MNMNENPETKHSYDDQDLNREMQEIVQTWIARETNAGRREWLESLNGLKLFGYVQKNFPRKLKTSYNLLNDDGSLKEQDQQMAMALEKTVIAWHLREIRAVIEKLGYSQEQIESLGSKPLSTGSPFTDVELEIIKHIFLEMRRNGIALSELIY